MAMKYLKYFSKSKFMRKRTLLLVASYLICFLHSAITHSSIDCHSNKTDFVCHNGNCKNNQCECYPGWSGKYCQYCKGRIRLKDLSGIITDGPGNYSENNHCTWLIEPSTSEEIPLRLYLNEFATECSWDHLYIYDGGSIYDPLLAVFSGVIARDHNVFKSSPEIVAQSGKALVYFYSDAAYNLTGFSIYYKSNGCPSDQNGMECHGHGVCSQGVCLCDSDWHGADCSQASCPNNCSGRGQCNKETQTCQCYLGYSGFDCKYLKESGWWESYPLTTHSFDLKSSYTELQRSSFTSSKVDDQIWLIGGYSFSPKSFIVSFNITDGSLSPVELRNALQPSPRDGHSSVVYEGKIYVFGGSLLGKTETKELWIFDPSEKSWTQIQSYGERPQRKHSNKRKQRKKRRRRRRRRDNRKPGKSSAINVRAHEKEKKKNLNDGSSGRRRNNQWGSRMSTYALRGSCLHPSKTGVSGACSPIAVVGHSAVVVEDFMLVIFGYSSTYGTVNLVQEFHFRSRQWKIVDTGGAVVSGSYGQSAVWDPKHRVVYVHGGLEALSYSRVDGRLLVYEPFKRKWSIKRPAPLPRYLHTASLANGAMLIFGGNTHNDTSFSKGAKCFSPDFHLYDVECDTWHSLQYPFGVHSAPVARYGHSVVGTSDEMIVFGGFNGVMIGNALRFNFGSCDHLDSKEKCLTSYPGKKCVWNRVLERCEILEDQDQTAHDFCLSSSDLSSWSSLSPKSSSIGDLNINNSVICNGQSSCHSCLNNDYGCVWCSTGCSYKLCSDYTKGVIHPDNCDDRKRWWCKSLGSCSLCSAYKKHCIWLNNECFALRNMTSSALGGRKDTTGHHNSKDPRHKRKQSDSIGLTPFGRLGIASNKPRNSSDNDDVIYSFLSCPLECNQRTNCYNCTQGSCMWCSSLGRCIRSNSYLVSFPYGQCRDWTTKIRDCPPSTGQANMCRERQSCDECHNDIACSWCDDGTGTGTGVCMKGGDSAPGSSTHNGCPRTRWFFTECPRCNCNGHSHCVNDSVCVQPCANNTEGAHCQKCRTSYYGKPINGGLCQPCQCNNHGVTCDSETGVCHCHTKGVTGDHCDKCDSQNNYYGEPLKGSCFYDLQIDYQFTFNLSKQEDAHIRQINFYNVPSKYDVDTEFDIHCSKPVGIKISARQTGGHEMWIVRNFTGMMVTRRFGAEDFVFGTASNNTTFHVYVFNFTPPIEIIISFSQHPKLDLVQFFSIFSACFLVLLLIAFLMWKVKQKYDLYNRRRRFIIEMDAMASRPFCSIFLEMQKTLKLKGPASNTEPLASALPGADPGDLRCPNKDHQNGVTRRPLHQNGVSFSKDYRLAEIAADLNVLKKSSINTKNNPSPISLETCYGKKAAVLSLLIELPTGGSLYTTPGHPGGLAIASTLVSLGAPPLTSPESSFFTKEGAHLPPSKKLTVVKLAQGPSPY